MRFRLAWLIVLGAACLGCRSRLPHIDPALAALIPSDTVLLAGAQVEPLRKHLQGRLPLLEGLDATEVLVVSNGVDSALLSLGRQGVATTTVAGSAAAVRAGSRPADVPAAIREGLRAIPEEHQVWIVAAGGLGALDPLIPRTGNVSNLRRLLSFVESLTASADVRTGLQGSAVMKCRTVADARSFSDAVRGFSLLAGYRDAVKVSEQGREVRVEISVR